MFSVIHRRNWQENQQKTSAAIDAQCTRCKEHENEIKTLKANLLTAKSANNERVQDLQNHVESLVFQNENLLKTIQKLVCQSTTSTKPTVKVPVVEISKQDVKLATVKKENATKKVLLDKGKTGVVGPQVKNKVIKGKSKNKLGNKVAVKKGNIGPKTTVKVKAENKTVKVENTGKTTPQVPFPGLGKEVKIVVRKLECEVSGQFLYIGGNKNKDNIKKNVNGEVSSDEEVDVERLVSSSDDSDSDDSSDDEVLNNGVISNKPIVSQNGEERVTLKCLWHQPGKLVCKKEFKSSLELGIHVRRAHMPFKGNVKCYWQNCVRQGRAFNRWDALKNHTCIHTGMKQFVCKVPGCGKAFIKKYDCQHHTCFPRRRVMKQRAHLPPSSNPTSAQSSTQSYPVTLTYQVVHTSLKHHWCRFPRCGKKFATSKSLKQHQDNVHCPAEKRFKCATCSKTFLYASDLERHEMLHRQKSFACPNCEKSFYDVQSLSSHKRSVHQEEKRYRCMHPNCSKMLSSSAALQKHVQTHTGQQPFRCSYPTCATRFTDKKALKKHLLRVHTGNKKRCQLEGCNEHFASRLLCVEHQLLVHPESFTNHHVTVTNGEPAVTITNGEPEVTEIDIDPSYEQETNFVVEPAVEKDTSYDIDIKYERSVQPEWDNFYGVKVKLEKPDAEENYDSTRMSYEENPYDMEEVNYEKSMPEDADNYDLELVNNGGYSDVTNGVAMDESDTNDSIVVVDVPEPVMAVPNIWFV